MEIWELVVRESCRDTLAQYSHAGDRYLLEEFAAAFCEDGVLEIRGSAPIQGRAAIMERFGGGTAAPGAPGRQGPAAGCDQEGGPPQRHQRPLRSALPDRGHRGELLHRVHRGRPGPHGAVPDRLVPVDDRWLIATVSSRSIGTRPTRPSGRGLSVTRHPPQTAGPATPMTRDGVGRPRSGPGPRGHGPGGLLVVAVSAGGIRARHRDRPRRHRTDRGAPGSGSFTGPGRSASARTRSRCRPTGAGGGVYPATKANVAGKPEATYDVATGCPRHSRS